MPMSDTDFFLPAQYVHQIADQVTRMGVRLPDWFQRLQRPGPQGELEVPELSFADFRHLVRDAMALTGEPAFGLLVGDRLMVSSHGLLGHVALHSQTLRQTVDAIEAYLQLRTSLLTLRQEVHGDRLRLVFVEPHPLGDIRLPVMEAIVLTIKNLIDYACAMTRPGADIGPSALPGRLRDATLRFNPLPRKGENAAWEREPGANAATVEPRASLTCPTRPRLPRPRPQRPRSR